MFIIPNNPHNYNKLPSGSSNRECPEIQDLPHLATRGPFVEALLPKPQKRKEIACRELTYPI